MATRKKKEVAPKQELPVVEHWPKVEVGTHLTVTRHEDGRTELVWDDEKLLAEIRAVTE